MRLKSTISHDNTEPTINCISWIGNDEILIGRDDCTLSKWSQATRETLKLCILPEKSSPVDLDVLLSSQKLTNKATGNEQVLTTTSDGKLYLMNKITKIDKAIDAHEGIVSVGKWSPDGSTLLTAGEDGNIKIWSRIGMLRTKLVVNGEPIMSADWNSDSSKIVYTQHDAICIKSLKPNVKTIRVRAHSNLVLKVSWGKTNDLIVSGGEDCCYKIWDSYGNSVFISEMLKHPVTSVCWKPDGKLLVVGSYNVILLCNQFGIIQSVNRVECGSIREFSWSPDSTQVASACANGKLMVSTIVERSVSHKNVQCLVTSRKTMTVKDVLNETKENLDFPERIIHVSLKHNNLVVITCTQCFVYRIPNLNTPQIISLKDPNVFRVILSEKNFAIFSNSSVSIYTYDCKLVSCPKWPNMQCDAIQENHLSMSTDLLAVRDQLNDKMVHIFEITPLSTLSALKHGSSITCIQLMNNKDNKYLAVIDSNLNISIVQIENNNCSKIHKIGSMFNGMCWNSQTGSLAALQYSNLIVWYDPLLLLNDPILIRKSIEKIDLSLYGTKLEIESYEDNVISLVNAEGIKVAVQITPYLESLKNYIDKGNWMECRTLCRAVKNEAMWAVLAGSAVAAKQLDTAEECFISIGHIERVSFIQNLKTVSDRSEQESSLALLCGKINDAESILLRSGSTYKAIMFNVKAHNWTRALELALKHKRYLNVVIYERRKYLESFKKDENNEKFLKYSDMTINEEEMMKEIQREQ
ncbi:intraflagellar transport protein 80 homolog isoform X2 [Adelges cooleyi]|uniref:intraflagellar transport protein 80 homolog isoform X2 n=1 Tax=Adelges cooleyi TaxID=133065 RepID=UPI00217F63A8|nr:intraflagellar transport protein 80 homolog isoform X2 [Adelges cooleyi]